MKSKLLHIIVLVGICLTFFSCSDDTEPEPKHYENVAIIYWMGDNSLSSWAEADIKELVAGKDDIPDSSTIIIYVDLANTTPIIYQLDRKEGLKVWKQYTVEEDCTDSLTLLNNQQLRTHIRISRFGMGYSPTQSLGTRPEPLWQLPEHTHPAKDLGKAASHEIHLL